MNTSPPSKPAQSREDRLKAALKANLARRKAQARAKSVQPEGTEADENEKKGS